MKLVAKVGLVAIGAGLGVTGAGIAMKMLGYNIVKNEEGIESIVVEAEDAKTEEEVNIAEDAKTEEEVNIEEEVTQNTKEESK